MAKITKINLNDFEQVHSEEELEGHTAIILTMKTPEGSPKLPDLYYRKPIKFIEFKNLDGVEWFKDIRISKEGTQEEYSARVKWWFEKAREDKEFREIVNNTFRSNGFDVVASWNSAMNYLLMLDKSKRKTYIKQFVWNWLTKGYHAYSNRKERAKSWK